MGSVFGSVPVLQALTTFTTFERNFNCGGLIATKRRPWLTLDRHVIIRIRMVGPVLVNGGINYLPTLVGTTG